MFPRFPFFPVSGRLSTLPSRGFHAIGPTKCAVDPKKRHAPFSRSRSLLDWFRFRPRFGLCFYLDCVHFRPFLQIPSWSFRAFPRTHSAGKRVWRPTGISGIMLFFAQCTFSKSSFSAFKCNHIFASIVGRFGSWQANPLGHFPPKCAFSLNARIEAKGWNPR